MTDDKDAEIAELKARLERAQSSDYVPVQPAKKGIGKGWIIAAIVAIGVPVAICSQADPTGVSGVTAASWSPPTGYSRVDAGRVAAGYQWVDPTAEECGRGRGSCWAVNVITERDCPRNLYASVTLFSSTGNNIGWTNDTAQGVQAGEVTHLVFTSSEEGADTARLAELSCY